MKRNCLYITYDGLFDPLGKSQIAPYLNLIAEDTEKLFILSFEKKNNRHLLSNYEKENLPENVFVKQLVFSQSFGFIGKIYDLGKMYVYGSYICLKYNIAIIHARGHPPAINALILKKTLFFRRLKYIFDFRGLWVDERIDKGSWDIDKLTHRIQFRIFKALERLLISYSDAIVVLTDAMKHELFSLGFVEKNIEVIPCCCNFNKFRIDSESYSSIRKDMNIGSDKILLGYIGSVGPMYDFKCMFKFFQENCIFESKLHLLLLTNSNQKAKNIALKYLKPDIMNKVTFRSVDHSEVPKYLAALDISIFFLKQSYARLGTSPTKFGESLASGVPVICNANIGDLNKHIDEMNCGLIIKNEELFSDFNAKKAVYTKVKSVLEIDKSNIRQTAKRTYDLSIAKQKYSKIYKSI